ncbi:PREDICTED: N-acetyltransferase ESCO2-like [Amphimedon queenslandica]|uniref:N-acetyltransferase domain-containing protein n=1 Tax=Amphimedon queenslandica TaxID=400682 RepID=A0A1X7V9M9_AMPQE|nr:PREDICTED: N-acetyltransferase ESCO2-like [Amphimedon queenslandica]|eukprot:XP_011402887.1 PREDICTED: N-acetyltransferase ESCO2-like [Amphimedon queenslandica]
MATVRKRPLIEMIDVLGKNPKKPKILATKQLHLDFGQKFFGPVQCKRCGMLYSYGQSQDELDHYEYHKKITSGIRFDGWKNERRVEAIESFDRVSSHPPMKDTRILLVLPTDIKAHLKKIDSIIAHIDNELGISTTGTLNPNAKLLMCISNRKVVGCIVVESITEGFRIMSNDENNSSSWSCSEKSEPALMGVNKVWVFDSFRRKGIARKLLDAARHNFKPGHIIPKEAIAFTDPTVDGRHFAVSYCGTPNFLIYR